MRDENSYLTFSPDMSALQTCSAASVPTVAHGAMSLAASTSGQDGSVRQALPKEMASLKMSP